MRAKARITGSKKEKGQRTGPVAVGIAGLGRSGWLLHAKPLSGIPDKFKVLATYDPDEARQKDAAEALGCKSARKFAELIKLPEVELVIVAVPSHLHAPYSIQALEAGKHVVSEKPMAMSVAEADRMLTAAKKSGKVLTVYQSLRYEASFCKVREILRSGKLGRIVHIAMRGHGFSRRWDWQTLKEFGGGSLNNTGSHIVDQALLLFGDAQPEVWCHMERVLTSGDAEDHVKIILRAPQAPVVDIELTSACAYPQERWLVMGSAGSLAGDGGKLRWKYVDFSGLPPRPVDRKPTPDRSYNREEYAWCEESWDAKSEPGPDVAQFYHDLHSTLRQGSPLAITPESVRRQIAVLETCHRLCPL